MSCNPLNFNPKSTYFLTTKLEFPQQNQGCRKRVTTSPPGFSDLATALRIDYFRLIQVHIFYFIAGPTTAGAFGLYKTKGVSNYDISTALYGAKDDSLNVTSASEVEDVGEFSMVEHVQSNHKFKLSVFQPNDPKNFIKFVRLEVKLLRSSLPTGTRAVLL